MSTGAEFIDAYPPWNFSWVVKDKLAAFGWPQTVGNLAFLYQQGIRHIVTLSPEKLPPMKEFSKMDWTQINIEEFEAPSLKQIIQFIEVCERCHSKNQAIGVHCRMGRGRTGVMTACYMVRFLDLHPDRAITNLRLQRPGSVETTEQERAVFRYHDYLRGMEIPEVQTML